MHFSIHAINSVLIFPAKKVLKIILLQFSFWNFEKYTCRALDLKLYS